MRIYLLAALVLAASACTSLGASPEHLMFEEPMYIQAAQAAAVGDAKTLEQLIRRGLDVNREGRETKTPWGKDTMTLLLWATLSESAVGVETLLSAGADVDKSTRGGMVPLMIAPALESNKILNLVLIRYKANPNRVLQIKPYKTPLMVVLQERRALGDERFTRAKMLLEHGARVDLDIDRGETATIAFSILGDWRAVFWLLEHGANHEARDSVGATVMCYLRNSYRANTLAPSEAYAFRDKVRDLLLKKGVARTRVDPALHPSPKCND